MFPKTGKEFLNGDDIVSEVEFADVIAVALREEFSRSRHAEKTIARWTGASNRSAKNWLAGTHGPSGAHLIALARKSDIVFKALVLLSGRPASALDTNLQALHAVLTETIEAIDLIVAAQNHH